MTRLRFLCQSKLIGKTIWNDEFWSYDPVVFYREFESTKQSTDAVEWRSVLRIHEVKTFEQIKKEQRKI